MGLKVPAGQGPHCGCRHLEKATRLVVVLSLLQTVHGSLQGNETGKEGDEVVDGDIYLGVFALVWS